jgi:diketogulonate reductase-like aldo/keto reductase
VFKALIKNNVLDGKTGKWFPLRESGVFDLIDIDPAETYKAMKLLDTGEIRAIGVSNFTISRLDDFLSKTSVVPAVDQIEVRPYLQQSSLFDYCKSKNILVEAYSPLGNNRTGEPRTVDYPLVGELGKQLGNLAWTRRTAQERNAAQDTEKPAGSRVAHRRIREAYWIGET